MQLRITQLAMMLDAANAQESTRLSMQVSTIQPDGFWNQTGSNSFFPPLFGFVHPTQSLTTQQTVPDQPTSDGYYDAYFIGK